MPQKELSRNVTRYRLRESPERNGELHVEKGTLPVNPVSLQKLKSLSRVSSSAIQKAPAPYFCGT